MIDRITQIELNNFQSHKHTVIDADTPVLILSGESNNGKTVIIRALSWLVTNRPTGDGFVSHWVKHENKKGLKVMKSDAECSVAIEFMDTNGERHSISRHKKASENWYVVDGTKLSAIGTDVPKEVTMLLGLNDTNIQNQDEPYFMLNLSGSQVSAKLNELVHLDTIDEAYSYTKKAKLDASADYKHAEKEYNNSKLNVLGMAYVPDMREDFDTVSEYIDNYDALVDRLEGMNVATEGMVRIKNQLKAMPNLKVLGEDIERIRKKMLCIDDLETERMALRTLRRQLEDVQDALSDFPHVEESLVHKAASLLRRYHEVHEDNLKYDALVKVLMDVHAERGKLPSLDAGQVQKLGTLIEDHAEMLIDVHDMADMIRSLQIVTEKKHNLPTPDDGKLDSLHGLIERHKELSKEEESMYVTIETCMRLKRYKKDADKKLAELEAEMPDICPFCGQPMDKEHVHA